MQIKTWNPNFLHSCNFLYFNLTDYCVWGVSKKTWFASKIFTTKTYWCLVMIWDYIVKCTDYLAAVTLANEIYFSNSRNARTPRITRYDCNKHHASFGVTLQEMHFDSSAEKIDHFTVVGSVTWPFECQQDWKWPCFDTDLTAFVVWLIIFNHRQSKQYVQNKLTVTRVPLDTWIYIAG